MFTWQVVAEGEGRAAEGQPGDRGSERGPGEPGVAGSWEVRLNAWSEQEPVFGNRAVEGKKQGVGGEYLCRSLPVSATSVRFSQASGSSAAGRRLQDITVQIPAPPRPRCEALGRGLLTHLPPL